MTNKSQLAMCAAKMAGLKHGSNQHKKEEVSNDTSSDADTLAADDVGDDYDDLTFDDVDGDIAL